MSTPEPKLVITYILPRAEDPALFDHMAGFRKGPTRTNRLKCLVRNGFMHERLAARGASARTPTCAAEANAVAPAVDVMDQMFTSVER